MIRPRDRLDGSVCHDMTVAFAVRSAGTARRDRKWTRQVFAALPAPQHFVIISPMAVDLTVFDRADGFAAHRLADLAASVARAAHGVALPLATLYRGTGLV